MEVKWDRAKTPTVRERDIIEMLNMARSGASVEEMRPLFDSENAYLIRECGVCNRVFFASRKNVTACSVAHATILRKRKYRRSRRLELELNAIQPT